MGQACCAARLQLPAPASSGTAGAHGGRLGAKEGNREGANERSGGRRRACPAGSQGSWSASMLASICSQRPPSTDSEACSAVDRCNRTTLLRGRPPTSLRPTTGCRASLLRYRSRSVRRVSIKSFLPICMHPGSSTSSRVDPGLAAFHQTLTAVAATAAAQWRRRRQQAREGAADRRGQEVQSAGRRCRRAGSQKARSPRAAEHPLPSTAGRTGRKAALARPSSALCLARPARPPTCPSSEFLSGRGKTK